MDRPASFPKPIPYELRLAIIGPAKLDDREAVADAIEKTLRDQVVHVLENASAEPHGAHGVEPGHYDQLLRALTRGLSRLTGTVCPMIERATAWLASLPERLGGRSRLRPLKLPVVPCALPVPESSRTTPLDLTVVTTLAQGTELVGAAVVCDRLVPDAQASAPSRPRIRPLEAVLPFDPTVWRAKFKQKRDKTEFTRLLKKDGGDPIIMRPKRKGAKAPNAEARAEGYDRARQRTIDSAEIVLAVWDPAADDDRIGEIVVYAVDTGRIVLWIDPNEPQRAARLLKMKEPHRLRGEPPWRLVVRVLRRLVPDVGAGASTGGTLPARGANGSPTPSDGRFVWTEAYTTAKQLSPNFHKLSAFNRDAAWDCEEHEALWNEECARLREAAADAGLPAEVGGIVCDKILPQFARADQQAQRYHALRDRAASLFPLTAGFVVTMIAFQIIFFPAHYWVAWIEVFIILVASISYRVSVYDAWHDKWLNDRHLAERLRALPFVAPLDALAGRAGTAAGDAARADDSTANGLPYYRPTNAWFEDTLARFRGRLRRRFAEALTEGDHTEAMAQFIRVGLVEWEAAHHLHAARRAERTQEWRHVLLFATTALIVVAAVLHALGVGHEHHVGHGDGHSSPLARLDLWVSFLSVAVPAWAASFHAMGAVHDDERLAERSWHMHRWLDGQAALLEEVETMDQLLARVASVKRILELENQDFAESMRTRPPVFEA